MHGWMHPAVAAIAIATATASAATQPVAPGQPTPPGAPRSCKMVTDNRASKPFEMCLTRAEWDAKAMADAKDPNRIVCHYEEEPGTRLRARKVCMTAAEWATQRQADREVTDRIQMQTCVPG